MEKRTLTADVARYELAAATAWIRAKFVEHTRYDGPTGCWEWQGVRGALGYGVLSMGGKNLRAHRLALHLAGRPVPANLVTTTSAGTRHV